MGLKVMPSNSNSMTQINCSLLDSYANIQANASSLQGFDELSEEDLGILNEGILVGIGPDLDPVDPSPAEEEAEGTKYTELKPVEATAACHLPSLATLKPTPFIQSENGDSLILLPNLLLPEDLVSGTILQYSRSPIHLNVCILRHLHRSKRLQLPQPRVGQRGQRVLLLLLPVSILTD